MLNSEYTPWGLVFRWKSCSQRLPKITMKTFMTQQLSLKMAMTHGYFFLNFLQTFYLLEQQNWFSMFCKNP